MREFETLSELGTHLAKGGSLAETAFQSLDLRRHTATLLEQDLKGCLFLGCEMEPTVIPRVVSLGALVLPPFSDRPFNAFRAQLYTPEELFAGYRPGQADGYWDTLDGKIYRHFLDTGGPGPKSILDSLSRHLHDHAITDALDELLTERRVVGMMGGHSLRRDDPSFTTVAEISRALTRRGYLMVSGGGPGAMEATHLGAWFAGRPDQELEVALKLLHPAPLYKPVAEWLDTASEVVRRFPRQEGCPDSVGIPTWLYGHEPPTMFASLIAKFFTNSIREEGLVTVAKGGLIFAPGSAGTIQEIFQDATQNHYKSLGSVSPMILLGEGYWTWKRPVYPLLAQMAAGREYAAHLHITDDPDQVVELIETFHA